jgi:hypothetical protein
MGIPFSRWGAKPFITHPMTFGLETAGKFERQSPEENQGVAMHPFELALLWKNEIRSGDLTKAGIAKREGVSRARVTQIMNLLRLPDVIQRILINPPPSFEIRNFPERRIRQLLSCGDSAGQLACWQSWLRELVSLDQN